MHGSILLNKSKGEARRRVMSNGMISCACALLFRCSAACFVAYSVTYSVADSVVDSNQGSVICGCSTLFCIHWGNNDICLQIFYKRNSHSHIRPDWTHL